MTSTIVRDQIMQHVRSYYVAVHLAWTKSLKSDEAKDMALATERITEVEAALVHFILGLIATPAPNVDPNEDTQLLETVKVEKQPKELTQRDQSLQRLFDELLIRQERIYQVIVKYLGGEPKTIQLRTADLLNSVIDLSDLMLAYGGDCADLVHAIRADEAARRLNTKRQVRSQENEAKPIMAKVLTAAVAGELGNPIGVLTPPAVPEDRSTPGYPAQFVVAEGDRSTPGYPAQMVEGGDNRTFGRLDEAVPPATMPAPDTP